MTDFQAAAEQYLALRRALGFKLTQSQRMLNSFTRYLHEQEAAVITTQIALEWSVLPAQASRWWWRQRLSVVRGFARYLQAFDPATEIPPTGLIYSPVPRAIPYAFSEYDVAALMTAAGALDPPLRAATYRTLIGLVAITGMRIGEAIALDDDDVRPHDRLIVVRDTKFGKSRQLVIHPTAAAALADYARTRQHHRPHPVTSAFFVSTVGTRLHYPNVSALFRRLAGQAGLSHPDNRSPRMHDLRHGFAMTTLAGWHADGIDAEPLLPVLSAYLGHATPAGTYWYLSATPGLLGQAARRLEASTEARS
ncbi:integrase [Nonomuraea thailandensis]|uniref:Integrase n=1 Tax=Nonomuraea thailandensis TaxID=1188745 RepID=A0A9X2JY22_9ACTN|nr:tyrosine-type recombinase/integrase [Nonomuraea thailandensis]MCP2353707.1 integrase [Nonomuraea thailandensis]